MFVWFLLVSCRVFVLFLCILRGVFCSLLFSVILVLGIPQVFLVLVLFLVGAGF